MIFRKKTIWFFEKWKNNWTKIPLRVLNKKNFWELTVLTFFWKKTLNSLSLSLSLCQTQFLLFSLSLVLSKFCLTSLSLMAATAATEATAEEVRFCLTSLSYALCFFFLFWHAFCWNTRMYIWLSLLFNMIE